MAHDAKTPREAAQRALVERPLASPPERGSERPLERLPAPKAAIARDGLAPPPIPKPASSGFIDASPLPPPKDTAREVLREAAPAGEASRRPARRRAAGPARAQIAANDDVPSIGGLIFALQQKPSGNVFLLATGASAGWFVVGLLVAWALLRQEMATGSGFGAALASPMMAVAAATISLPIALFWFLALLAWRTQELKLMSSAMTEVAVRLAEPDRAAEQSAASLGQAVRRQVSFMNEAISRALGRAGELEALVHNEVSALEKSYGENEHKIKGLIQELVGERHALVSTTDKVAETLKAMGSDVPNLIEKLSDQQIKLAKIIEGAGQNLIALENQLSTASGSLETALANRTQQLQAVLDDYTVALDATLANRAEALDMQLVERTRALDAAFSERLALFDDTMLRSTMAIDSAVNEKARALTIAMENHVRALSDTMGRQAINLDESMMHGIDAVRRTSEGITRQSLKAIEGLSGQADLLKNVSENLLNQVSSVTNRVDHQGQSIVSAANALEHVNKRFDSTVQNLGSIANRFSETSDEVRAQAARAAASLQVEQERIRADVERLPIATRESAESMRSALNEQLRALEQLSTLAHRERRDVAPPLPGPIPATPVSLTAAYAAQNQAHHLSLEPGENGDRWSLGDLLARASRDEDGTARAPMIDLENIARALDPSTASAIWSRFRAGQRGIMVRSIYTAEGRVTFDEVSERYGRDMNFRRTADRFLADFERMVRDAEQKNPRGVHDHLISDAGRVYLFLAHASGRLR